MFAVRKWNGEQVAIFSHYLRMLDLLQTVMFLSPCRWHQATIGRREEYSGREVHS